MKQVNIKSSGGGISTNTGMVVVHNHTIVNLNNDLLKIISEQHRVINQLINLLEHNIYKDKESNV